MKKILPVISIIMVLFMMTATFVSANRFFQEEGTGIGAVSVTKGSPNIDGTISNGEGWTGPVNFDKKNYGTAYSSHSDYEFSGGLYFASDDNGIYFAGMLNDNFDLHVANEIQDENGNWYYDDPTTFHNGVALSTADTSKDSTELSDGFDGDVFTLQIDPQNWFVKNGFTSNDDHSAWYNVSLMESDGNAHINRTQVNNGDIPGAKAAGSVNANGWTFEAFVPWSEIVNDCKTIDSSFDLTAADLAAAAKGDMLKDLGDGTYLVDKTEPNSTWTSVEVIYVDRYVDEDTGDYSTWQRYCTVPGAFNGGTGEDSDGVSVQLCGIYLKLGADESGTIAGYGGDPKTGSNIFTGEKGKVTPSPDPGLPDNPGSGGSGDPGSGGSGKGGSTSGGGSAQTFDAGIVTAVAVAAAAGAGVIITKRKFR